MMNAIERIQAAINKLEALKVASTPGPWMEWHSNMDDANGQPIPDEDMDPENYEPFYCPPVTGCFLIGAHERKVQEANAELIVTLHRTIDAQLAILWSGLEWLHEFELDAPTYADGRPMSATRLFKVTSQGRATLTLADEILGDA